MVSPILNLMNNNTNNSRNLILDLLDSFDSAKVYPLRGLIATLITTPEVDCNNNEVLGPRVVQAARSEE